MLTKDDLQAIKQITQLNNKVLGTIVKVELADTNKRVDHVVNELANTNKRVDHVVNELANTNKRVDIVVNQLSNTNNRIEFMMHEMKIGQERLEMKIDGLHYSEHIKQLEKRVNTLESVVEKS